MAAWAFARGRADRDPGRGDRRDLRGAGPRRQPARRRRAAGRLAAGPQPPARRPRRRRGPEGAPWLSVRTSCSAAACRSTATSTARPSERLLLSNDADFDRVDAVRAECDAILVGAAHGPAGQPAAAGPLAGPARRPGGPRPAAVADQGDRDRRGRSSTRARSFFTAGDTEKIVYCASARGATRPGTGSARWPPWSTAASRSTCAG